ncbi:hypothetical protein [Streptomyces cucumeris]|uniref:hypothetical protein n=1 Tax=Streptomyces cucumeris TaxID=2962890 RepID=UPI003D70F471
MNHITATAKATGESGAVDRTRAARRAGLASFIGTTVEWYDFSIYSTASRARPRRCLLRRRRRYDRRAGGIRHGLLVYSVVQFFVQPFGVVLAERFGPRRTVATLLGLNFFLVPVMYACIARPRTRCRRGWASVCWGSPAR